MIQRATVVTLVVLAMAGAVSAKTRWEGLGEGQLEIRNGDLQPKRASVRAVAPLRHTDVKIQVRGFVAEVTVQQEFFNPLDRPIEAEYVFPLPHDSAVNATEMRIGERVITGKIDRRASARQKYEQARDAGKRAALLEQERPNIFTQSVANIAANETVHVTIRYVQTLPYADGRYELVFPMVVGPRYIPGAPVSGERANRGGGRLDDTDQVPDASRITPPVVPPGQRCGHDISLAVDLDAGVPLGDVTSRAHQVAVSRDGEDKARVVLSDADAIPNKDFVLSFTVAGGRPEVGFLAHHDGKKGHFTLVLQPPADPPAAQIRPREILCVLDCSGSMDGPPLRLSKHAAGRILDNLRPTDRFNLMRFSSRATTFQPRSVPATPANIHAGRMYLASLAPGGGTEMIAGVRQALRGEIPEDLLRIVVLFTDGYIGNEKAILAEVKRKIGPARMFSFGVGSSSNRYLLDRMAIVGRGTAQYVLLADDPSEAVDAFVNRIDSPVLTDIEVKFHGAEAADVIPALIPDVFAGLPVYVHGRYDKPGKATIRVSGRIGATATSAEIEVDLPAPDESHSPLPSVWARRRIKELELRKLAADTGGAERVAGQIAELALEYSLMSAYTSFVAIDEGSQVNGKAVRVPVSIPMPEGVSYERTVAPTPRPSGGGFYLPGRGGGPVGVVGWAAVAALVVATLRRKKDEDVTSD
ncbi:MAG: VIT domain-containing protein, partial [Planctomycetota bacterium]